MNDRHARLSQKLQVERSALRRVAGLSDHASTGIAPELDEAQVGRALAAVGEAVKAFGRAWRAERRGYGLGVVPFLAGTAALTAALTKDRPAPARTIAADFPLPDAHSEARLPDAA